MFEKKEFSGWPSGDPRPIMELKFEPDEITEKYNIEFIRDKDNLDWYKGAHIYCKGIGPVAFIRHESSAVPGTGLYVDSMVDFTDAYNKILRILDIKESDIIWKTEFINELNK